MVGEVSSGQGESWSAPGPGMPPFTLATYGRGPWAGGTRQRVDKGPAPPKLTPVNVSIVCKGSESTYCLHSYVCPLVHTHCPSGGPLSRFIFLGCTFVSPVAKKVPGPHWA